MKPDIVQKSTVRNIFLPLVQKLFIEFEQHLLYFKLMLLFHFSEMVVYRRILCRMLVFQVEEFSWISKQLGSFVCALLFTVKETD